MTDAGRAAWAPLLPTEPIAFPDDFMWGVASSAFQAEGGEVPNDWTAAARAGRVPPNPGNGFWERAEEDFAIARELGFGHYRLSIEWSRVQPERNRFDDAAIDRYVAMCDSAVQLGLTPWVNFFHFTVPDWCTAAGGLLEERNHDAFRYYVDRVARALAPIVTHFHLMNEPMAYVGGGFLTGQNPPFLTDLQAAHTMTRHTLKLYADGYNILKSVAPDCTVATIEVNLDPHVADPSDPGQQAFCAAFDTWYQGTWLTALATGVVDLPGRDPEEIPGLRRALDLYGYNYYHGLLFGGDNDDGPDTYAPRPDTPRDGMGRFAYPAGFEHGLHRIRGALPGVPIYVAENGCPTTDEAFRIRYLAAHLAALDRARRSGIDVRGYFHWTLVDNYEWLEGFAPHARFGLVASDPESQARQVKASGRWLADVIAAGRLDPATVP